MVSQCKRICAEFNDFPEPSSTGDYRDLPQRRRVGYSKRRFREENFQTPLKTTLVQDSMKPRWSYFLLVKTYQVALDSNAWDQGTYKNSMQSVEGVFMPVCQQETSVFPSDLLQMPEALVEASPGEGQRRWWVLYTKSRQEKSLARDLLQYQIPFYLPLVKSNKVYRKWKVLTYNPLFSGYVFLFGSGVERGRSLTTNRLSRILAVEDGDGLLHDLRQLQLLIASDAPLTLESRLAAGAARARSPWTAGRAGRHRSGTPRPDAAPGVGELSPAGGFHRH